MTEQLVPLEDTSRPELHLLKQQLGPEKAELAMARGSIEARINAQQQILDGLSGIPARFEVVQTTRTQRELDRLVALQELPDDEVVSWYRDQRASQAPEEAHDEPSARPTHEQLLSSWQALTTTLMDAMSEMGDTKDPAVYEILDEVTDMVDVLCEAGDKAIEKIEAPVETDTDPASIAEVMVPSEVEAPVAQEEAREVVTLETPLDSQPENPGMSVLSVPDDFMDQLRVFVGERPRKIGTIIFHFWNEYLSPLQLQAFHDLLRTAREEGIVTRVEDGMYVSDYTPIPEKGSVSPAPIEDDLTAKLKAAGLGTSSHFKPKQRGRRPRG